MERRVLVTGAGGFVGSHLCAELAAAGLRVRAAVRKPCSFEALPAQLEQEAVGEIGSSTDWSAALADVDAVVHLAARTHILDPKGGGDIAAFRSVNVAGTQRLAEACIHAGVRRFVLLSSIKAVGEETKNGEYFSEETPCRPRDPYGISKRESEQALLEIVAGGSLDVMILRAPLVYGPRVRANFLRLMAAIDRGMPLPLGAVRAKRSLLFVGNLTSAIARCIDHPTSGAQICHVADDAAVSSRELALNLGELLQKPARLLPVPILLLQFAGAVLGRSEDMRRLTGSLLVSTDRIRRFLGWTPPFTVAEGLLRTVQWYVKTRTTTA